MKLRFAFLAGSHDTVHDLAKLVKTQIFRKILGLTALFIT